jgi:hypothetical protein
MKSFVKYALAGVALAAASGAYADVTPGSSGNGELMLVVRDLSSPTRVFTTGLGLTLDSFLNQAQLTATPGTATDLRNGVPITGQGSSPTVNFTSGALQSFMGVGSALGYEWAVLGSDSLGTSTTANTGNGSVRVLTTSETQFSASLLSNTGYTAIGGNGGVAANMSLFFDENNALLADGPGTSIDNGTYGQTGFGFSAPTLFGTAGNLNDPAANAGVSQRLYMLTSGGSSTSAARIYQFADLSLSTSGVLTSAAGQTPEVPLPAAVWLLGSALVGLTTVRRRKSAEVAA